MKPTFTPAAEATSPTVADLLHELQVHQIELEMQNEALRSTQIALEESRDRYVDLFEFAPVGYLTLSREGQIVGINLTGATLLREDRANLLRLRFTNFVIPADQERWQGHFLHAIQFSGKQTCELGLQRKDGSVFSACLDCLLTESNDAAPTLRITMTDITERQQIVAQLRNANARLARLTFEQAGHLRQLAGELTYAEQHERDRLYELLHGDVQPMLVAARLLLSGLSARTPVPDTLRIAADACAHISRVIQVARTLSVQLSPPLIRERGLIAAIESLCQWVRINHGLEVVLASAPDAEPEDMAMRLLCFNAVRELLMNVVKHAGTKEAMLTLQVVERDSLQITVTDTGCGFDQEAVSSGTGLAQIERRLGMFGGSLQIESQPGHGTVTTLCAPLRSITREYHDDQDTDRR